MGVNVTAVVLFVVAAVGTQYVATHYGPWKKK